MDNAAAAETFMPAAARALKEWAIAPTKVHLVSVSENVTFRVEHDSSSYVLRLHRPGYHTLEELVSERTWTRALAASGIGVPIGVATPDGRDYVSADAAGEQRYVGLTRWVEGRVLADVLDETQDIGQTESYFEDLGRVAGSIHNQASDWERPERFTRHALDADGFMGTSPFWGPFWELASLSAPERALLIEARARLHAVLMDYGTHSATYSLIHADLHPGNLLVDGNRLHVIDFDDAGFGWHVYELAVALFSYQASPDFSLIKGALIRGYREARFIADDDLALVPMFLLIRGLALLGWIHQRPEFNRNVDELKSKVCVQCEGLELP